MAKGMDALYESAKTYATILKNCSLPQVADWKLEDVKRAHQWAEYFNKVQNRIVDKPATIGKLDTRLRAIGQQLGVRFGEEELSYNFLLHSSEYFTKCLLDNPVLPRQLYDEECALSPTIARQHILEAETNHKLLSSLKGVHEKLTACCGEVVGPLQSQKALDASYLRKHVAWLVETQPASTRAEDATVEGRLCSLAATDGGMEVILLSLIQDAEDCSSPGPTPQDTDHLDPARRAILDWLLKVARGEGLDEQPESSAMETDHPESREDPLSETLWQRRHCGLVASVSARYSDVFKAHFQLLAQRTKLIEKKRLETSVERRASAEGGGSDGLDNQQVEWATSHWLELTSTQHRDTCVSFLSEELEQLGRSEEDKKRPAPIRESIWYTLLTTIQSTRKLSLHGTREK